MKRTQDQRGGLGQVPVLLISLLSAANGCSFDPDPNHKLPPLGGDGSANPSELCELFHLAGDLPDMMGSITNIMGSHNPMLWEKTGAGCTQYPWTLGHNGLYVNVGPGDPSAACTLVSPKIEWQGATRARLTINNSYDLGQTDMGVGATGQIGLTDDMGREPEWLVTIEGATMQMLRELKALTDMQTLSGKYLAIEIHKSATTGPLTVQWAITSLCLTKVN